MDYSADGFLLVDFAIFWSSGNATAPRRSIVRFARIGVVTRYNVTPIHLVTSFAVLL